MNYCTEQDLIDFETDIRKEWEAGNLPCLLHLSGGNEKQLVRIFADVNEGDWIFSTHRNHLHALLAGIPADKLRASIMRGDSMFTYSKERNFFSSAILAGCCGIAAGVAWTLKAQGSLNQAICFLGDGAEEQGHFYEAALFVEANDLPCRFIIEDNNRQVDTDKVTRRGTRQTANRPLDHFNCVSRYFYQSTYPHAGSGCTFKIEMKPDAIERMRNRT